jgi:predicted transcriptional regulator
MDTNALINEVLEYLFNGYIHYGGTGLFPINEISEKHGVDSAEIGKYLVSAGLVKHQQFRHDGFSAAISIQGIYKIKPQFLEDHTSTIVSFLGVNGNEWTSIMEILNFEHNDFQIAHDFANFLKNNDLIDAQFHHNDVLIKLTFQGQRFYEDKSAFFF